MADWSTEGDREGGGADEQGGPRGDRLDPDTLARRRFELAALETSGQVGYRSLTVQQILDRAGSSRPRFYRHYENKAACYARGYELEVEPMAQCLITTGVGAPDWTTGFAAMLWKLESLIEAQPLLARGLIAEVHVAGGAALAKRNEVFERLSRAIDLARRETESRHSPPPIAASFILSAIEAAVVRSFFDPKQVPFAASVPDLAYIGSAIYFGEREALAAARKARRPS
jgi:AcrR family transcriptional regulator